MGGVIWVVGFSIACWKFVKGKEIPSTTLAQVGGSRLGKRFRDKKPARREVLGDEASSQAHDWRSSHVLV
jgi:hypothetical protein